MCMDVEICDNIRKMFSGFHRNDSNYSSVVLECVVVLCWSYNVLHFGCIHFIEMNKKLISQYNSYVLSLSLSLSPSVSLSFCLPISLSLCLMPNSKSWLFSETWEHFQPYLQAFRINLDRACYIWCVPRYTGAKYRFRGEIPVKIPVRLSVPVPSFTLLVQPVDLVLMWVLAIIPSSQ